MEPGLNRRDLQIRAQAKIDDAGFLLANGRYGNAYYLAGYAVELGLKACIAAQIEAETLPEKKFVRGILSHDFKALVALADLTADLTDEQDRDPKFDACWNQALQWTPDARYGEADAVSAQVLVQAIADPNSGVLRWIQAYW
jgi:HEPN domain-containing protein